MHADIKKNIQPCYPANDGGQLQYPPSTVGDLPYLHPEGGGASYEGYSSSAGGRRQVTAAGTYNQDPHPDQRVHHHDNQTNPAPQDQSAVVSVSGSSSAVYLVEGEEGEGRGGEGELQLKDPAYYEATPYSSGVGGASGVTSFVPSSSAQYPGILYCQHSMDTTAIIIIILRWG